MSIDPQNLGATAQITFDDEFNTLNLWNGSSGTWATNYWWAGASGSTLSGNGEQEWYINSLYAPTSSVKPWTVNNGILTLTAAPADPSIQPLINNYQYTSGFINTYHSFSQTYGYFEMRAELPAGQGMWPAFWLLPEDGSWPPEIDVMEVLGNDPTKLYTTVHTNSTGTHTANGVGTTVANMSTGFHTYGVDWEPDYLTFYFDGQQVFKTPTPSDLNKPMYLLANLAVGGYWPGMVDSTTPFPAQMQIDYIRAYSASPAGSSPPSTTPPATTPPSSSGGTGVVLTATDAGSVLTGGPGDDTLIAGHNSDTLTGGGGADTFVFKYLPWNAGKITDFTPGTDKLDLTGLFTAANYTGSNPVVDGYLQFSPDGNGGTNVLFDPDGPGTANPWPIKITDLVGVLPSSIGASDWIYSATAGSSSTTPPPSTPPTTPPTTPPPPSSGGPGVVLTATDAGSVLTGGPGDDTLIAGHNRDTLTGGGGADSFVFKYLPWNAGTITDFTPGTDKIDLTALFSAANYTGSNPIADGYLQFSPDGNGGTNVLFDPDGPGTANPWPIKITDLVGVSPSSISPSDWIYTTTGGSSSTTPPPSTPPTTPPTTPPPPTSTPGVVLTATDAGSVLTGGPGDDTLIAGHNRDTLTGGAGADTFVFKYLPWNAGTITDFTPGTDKLDLTALFAAANYTGSNPIADGYLQFSPDGNGGTNVLFDPDGPGTANPWPIKITDLLGVSPSSISPSDWIYTTNGSPSPTTPPPTSTPTTPITGVTLTATDAGSTLVGGPGNDLLIAGHNADTLTGGAGSDIFQFNYLPWNAGHITDFQSGVDHIDINALFALANYQGTNPIGDGYLSFASDGAGGTKIFFDVDGWASGNPWPIQITTLDHVPLSSNPMDWFVH